MTWNMKYNLKKFIAIVLAVAVLAGVYHTSRMTEVMAQEKTLPGIEQLVQDTVNSGETFHILEVVPDRKDASIGYLIGGEEPVSEGRKLSELPVEQERIAVMQALAGNLPQGLVGDNGPVSFQNYSEENGSRTEDVRGRFVFRGEGGHYAYQQSGASYRMLADGETTSEQRYDRYVQIAEQNSALDDLQAVNPTMAMRDGTTAGSLEIKLHEGITVNPDPAYAYVSGRYALRYYDAVPSARMDSVNDVDFQPDIYVGLELWQQIGEGTDAKYTYVGQIIKGSDIPEGVTVPVTSSETVSDMTVTEKPETGSETENTVSGNNATVETVAEAAIFSVSSGDAAEKSEIQEEQQKTQNTAVTMSTQSVDADSSLFVYRVSSGTVDLWALCKQEDGSIYYELSSLADVYFLYFDANDSGDYYFAEASYCDDGDFWLSDSYVENTTENGRYVLQQAGQEEIILPGEAGYDPTQTYDFVGDDSCDSRETISYAGGFYSKEWFKKNVLNLSGTSRYEEGTSSSSEMDIDRLKIEVTTVTVEELAELSAALQITDAAERERAIAAAYCGIDLTKVNMIYLSGRGEYTACSTEIQLASVATVLARLGYGYGISTDGPEAWKTTRADQYRIPVVMDYGFYSQNLSVGNEVLAKLALSLLLVSDDSVAEKIAAQGDAFWTGEDGKLDSLKESVNTYIQKCASARQTADSESLLLEKNVFEFLSENVYLNNDNSGTTPYVAADYLSTEYVSEANSWIYREVQEEIQYENFLIQREGSSSTEDLLAEEITKASVTRYILNWYQHRIIVKTNLKVLDLEPCYDFDEDSVFKNKVKQLMGGTDSYQGEIDITKMASTEFIGKVEDLNASYDMIYIGTNVGNFNTDANGDTVYNDTNMNGMIYTHVGDAYDYSGESLNDKQRLRDDALVHIANQYDGSQGDMTIASNIYRGPGNDMNSTRFEEFKQYIQAGYPVVLSNKLLQPSGASELVASNGTMDSNSYFYKLVQFALSKDSDGNYLYWQKNVFAEGQLMDDIVSDPTAVNILLGINTTLEQRRNSFCNYLNLSKLTVDWVKDLNETYCPKELYTADAEEGTLTEDRYLEMVDGKYQLQYIISLTDDSAVSKQNTKYDCRLFVDSNSDGRFAGSDVTITTSSATEELTGLTIYERSGNSWKTVTQSMEGTPHYELQTGKTYKIVRELPETYVGVVPWKIVFYDNTNRLVRTSLSGYTAVPKRGNKEPIDILQIMSDSDDTWNLEEDTKFQGYLKLDDYEVHIDSIKSTELVNQICRENGLGYDSDGIRVINLNDNNRAVLVQKLLEKFNQYDMLIVGFDDNYRFGPKLKTDAQWKIQLISGTYMLAGEAVKDYIESGRNVLFTHDTTSYISDRSSAQKEVISSWGAIIKEGYNDWYWGYELNRTIRAAVGLDRYGDLKTYYAKMSTDTSIPEADRNRYTNYLKTLSTDYQYDKMLEPGTSFELGQKEGLTKYTVVRFMTTKLEALRNTGKVTDNFYFPVNNDLLAKVGYNNQKELEAGKLSVMLMGTYAYNSQNQQLRVMQVNEGQITSYPYLITKEDGDELKVNSTHYQWLQPNMELDKDGDGKNDIIVWYTISDVHNTKNASAISNAYAGEGNNIYSIDPKDVVNNYYIYTMGNVTYSGAGHHRPESTTEMKLFVNTLIAAYSAGAKAPAVQFQNAGGDKVNTISMIYDAQNHMILNLENDRELEIRFKATDYNVISGGCQPCVEFYKSCSDDDPNGITLSGIEGKVVPLTIAGVKDSAGNAVQSYDSTENGAKYYPVANGNVYTMTYSLEETGLLQKTGNEISINDTAEASKIYIRAYSIYDNGTQKTPSNTASLGISAQELFELN